MKRIVRLNERDLSRIVKRVLREGVILPSHKFKSDTAGYEVTVDCTKGEDGAGSITGGRNNTELKLEGDMYNFFC
jgi:hypothetical protein